MGVELFGDGPLDGALQGTQQETQADVEGDSILGHLDNPVGAATLELEAIAFPVEAGLKLVPEGLCHLVDLATGLLEAEGVLPLDVDLGHDLALPIVAVDAVRAL